MSQDRTNTNTHPTLAHTHTQWPAQKPRPPVLTHAHSIKQVCDNRINIFRRFLSTSDAVCVVELRAYDDALNERVYIYCPTLAATLKQTHTPTHACARALKHGAQETLFLHGRAHCFINTARAPSRVLSRAKKFGAFFSVGVACICVCVCC